MGGTISSGKMMVLGTVFSRSILSIGDAFPNPQKTEVPTVTFRLAVSSDLPTTARTIWGKSKSRAELNMKFRGREKNLTKKYSQQMQYNHCYTKISHKNGIPTNLLFRCINFFSTLGPVVTSSSPRPGHLGAKITAFIEFWNLNLRRAVR